MKARILTLAFVMFAVLGFAAIDFRADSTDQTNTTATTWTITKVEDTNDGLCDADCSLREAVAAATSGDTIVFSPLFNSPQTITLLLGQITIDKNLTITGTGSNLIAISANMSGRIFNMTGSISVMMSGMNLRDGRVGANLEDGRGGAILFIIESGNGTLGLSNMEFTNNAAYYAPDHYGLGAGVYCYGCTITATNLHLHDNVGPGNASAIDADSATVSISDSVIDRNIGGATGTTLIVQDSSVTENLIGGISGRNITLINSTVSNNHGRGVFGGGGASTMSIENSTVSGNTDGGLSNDGFAVIKNTLVSNNQKSSDGAGITNFGTMYIYGSAITGNSAGQNGGGLVNSIGQLALINSTVSGNFAGTTISNAVGGGIYGQVDIANPNGRLILTNSTITNNQSSGNGGGLRQDLQGTTRIRNTIVSGNTSSNTSSGDVSGAVISNGVNLVGNTTGSSGWLACDLLNVNPILGPLAENGGGTMTRALLPGSPAIDAGNNSTAIDPQTQMPLITDQRGFKRVSGGTVDIGAYEEQPVITGTVTYGNAVGSPTPRFVSGVLLTAIGPASVSATNRLDGTYTLGGFGSGSYTVTPTKVGDVNGISSFDAARIAQHVAGLNNLTGNQLIVADVSGNGTISSFDAGEIARYVAGLNNSGATGNWIFQPVNRFYPSVTGNLAGEDFIALLMGEVSGNWREPVGSRRSAVGGR